MRPSDFVIKVAGLSRVYLLDMKQNQLKQTMDVTLLKHQQVKTSTVKE